MIRDERLSLNQLRRAVTSTEPFNEYDRPELRWMLPNCVVPAGPAAVRYPSSCLLSAWLVRWSKPNVPSASSQSSGCQRAVACPMKRPIRLTGWKFSWL